MARNVDVAKQRAWNDRFQRFARWDQSVAAFCRAENVSMPSFYQWRTDLRKSFDGLSGLVESVFGRNVTDGHLFLFVNKRRDRIKAMWWDRDGLAIWYKRLEGGSFEMPRSAADQVHLSMDATELAMLLGGVSLASVKRRKRFALSA